MRIAVIGAGLAGLTAARAAADAGHEVTVYDKGRGLGGRLATRRTEAGAIDHGAPWLKADGAFADVLDDLARAGAAARHGDGWVGLPAMSALVRPLAEGIEILCGAPVTSLDPEAGTVVIEDAPHGRFDRIVLAIPAPQARELTGAAELDAVEMVPTWTLLAAFETPLDLPDVVRPKAGPVALALRNSAKPGRSGESWVLHMGSEWSLDNLERRREEVMPDLAGFLGELTGSALPDPTYLAVHRWRYARAMQPLGAPFLSLAGARVLVGGDWALGSDAGHAWESGLAMAVALTG